jgi:probable HAF family extracellular repeat protein
VPGAFPTTQATGINDAGHIVGNFDNSTGRHGFLDAGGNFTQIDVPGATFTSAFGVNGTGQIVGAVAGHGFLDTGGSFTQIDVPGASGTNAFGINGAGQIVGLFDNSTGQHGFLDTGGTFTQIDVPGASQTYAFGINDAGQIVGTFVDTTGRHGFLDTGGNFTQLDVPSAISTIANGINDAGRIVGDTDVGASATGDPHFITYDGVHYDYQGVGDFLLARSTVSGDQFDVQIRTTASWWNGSVPVSFMSEAAATLCNHNVTFDIDRASAGGSFIWLDGSPLSLSAANTVLNLGSCQIDELSPDHYQVVWSTGEMLDVTDNGTYLDLSSQLSWIDGLGSMEGLLSSDLNPDLWRVIGATSLLDPVPEPGTFTLLASALAGLAIIRRRDRSRSRRSQKKNDDGAAHFVGGRKS